LTGKTKADSASHAPEQHSAPDFIERLRRLRDRVRELDAAEREVRANDQGPEEPGANQSDDPEPGPGEGRLRCCRRS